MRCPFCAHEESKVLDSRPVEDGASIRRRRECIRCSRRFTTYERMDHVPIMVVKRDGRREPFDRNKILRGLVQACGKRPVSIDDLERVGAEVEREVTERGDQHPPCLRRRWTTLAATPPGRMSFLTSTRCAPPKAGYWRPHRRRCGGASPGRSPRWNPRRPGRRNGRRSSTGCSTTSASFPAAASCTAPGTPNGARSSTPSQPVRPC